MFVCNVLFNGSNGTFFSVKYWYWHSVIEKLTRLPGYEIKRMKLIFNTKMLNFKSKANLDEEILFGKITYHLNQETRKILVWGMFGAMIPNSILVYNLLAIDLLAILKKNFNRTKLCYIL